MSQENVELVQRYIDAFNAGGVEALLAGFTADVVVYPYPEWVEESEYRGHEGLWTVLAVWTENFDEFQFAVHEVREVGDRVLLLGETAGRIKSSGVPIRQPLGLLYSDFRNGQIGKVRSFLAWQQALEAVGLRE